LKGQWNMTPTENQGTFTVILHKLIIVRDDLVFDAEREVRLPIPFVGLQLYNTEWTPPGCDETEDRIQAIGYDLKTGQLICYLPVDDYSPEENFASMMASGGAGRRRMSKTFSMVRNGWRSMRGSRSGLIRCSTLEVLRKPAAVVIGWRDCSSRTAKLRRR